MDKILIQKAADYIRGIHSDIPKTAIILGSGLGSFADSLTTQALIETKDIPFFPRSTVKGHRGRLIFGTHNGIPIVALQGRTHYYEGYGMNQVTLIIHIFAALQVDTIIITNAAGSVNLQIRPGDLMVIEDQINLMGTQPQVKLTSNKNPFYINKQSSFSPEGIELVESVAKKINQTIKRGVLLATSGPSYETASEIEMARLIGADAVSMSTIPEVITACSYDMNVIGISCITNMATGINLRPLSHEEVTDTAQLVQNKFFALTTGIIDHFFESITRP